MPEVILSVTSLEKSYDDVKAVAGLDFEIEKGECFLGYSAPTVRAKVRHLRCSRGWKIQREDLFNITAVRSRLIIKHGLVFSSRQQRFKIF